MPRPMQSVKTTPVRCPPRQDPVLRSAHPPESRTVLSRPPVRLPPAAVVRRKLVRPVIRPIGQANPLQNRQCAFATLIPRNPCSANGSAAFSVLSCPSAAGTAGNTKPIFSHCADAPAVCRQMCDCCSVEQVFAVGQDCPADPEWHECAFARAGCAGHRNVVTVLHGQIDRIERTNAVLSIYFSRMNQF